MRLTFDLAALRKLLEMAETEWKERGASPLYDEDTGPGFTKDALEFALDHKAFARAFESFPQDADKLYPDWRKKLRINSAA